MFMTFYRGFAQPIELLRQIISRFDALARGEKSDEVMIRYSLMKLTTMLGDWMHEYPGDLSSPETYGLLCDFFSRILRHDSTMHVAAPMQPLLAMVQDAPDLDAAWSKNQDNDKPSSVAADVPPIKPSASRGRASSTSSSAQEAATRSPLLAVEGRQRSGSEVTHSSEDHHSYTSASGSSGAAVSASAAPTSGTSSGASSHALPSLGFPATMHDRKSLLRNTAAAILELKDEVVAHELTRIEWDLFSAIGPRDLLRHILVSRELRSPESPVACSIAHFNYISGWVCSLILVHSKARQRARMLEKFIDIAGVLRRTNNYNSLNAVIAALGNSATHRLKQTFELIQGKRIHKTYLSLSRLMCSDRSFAAYRLALENSDPEARKIPYLGVHLQDILSTSDGNPSKRSTDGMIHWRKFSLMYDAVMAIVRCQEYQVSLSANPSVAKLIVDQPIMDEDVSKFSFSIRSFSPSFSLVDLISAIVTSGTKTSTNAHFFWLSDDQAILPRRALRLHSKLFFLSLHSILLLSWTTLFATLLQDSAHASHSLNRPFFFLFFCHMVHVRDKCEKMMVECGGNASRSSVLVCYFLLTTVPHVHQGVSLHRMGTTHRHDDASWVPSMMDRLTRDDKIALSAGMDIWRTVPIPDKGVPYIKTTDGPAGARGGGDFNVGDGPRRAGWRNERRRVDRYGLHVGLHAIDAVPFAFLCRSNVGYRIGARHGTLHRSGCASEALSCRLGTHGEHAARSARRSLF